MPLHHVPQGKRRAVHSQRHLARGRRRGPRRHGKLEGFDGCPPLLPVLRRWLGAFDAAPTDLVPTYELWVGRRETWVKVVAGAEQFPGNRAAVA